MWILLWSPFILPLVGIFVVIFFPFVFLKEKIEDKIHERRIRRLNKQYDKLVPAKKKKPNVFVEYMKAKKEKVCPLIEYED